MEHKTIFWDFDGVILDSMPVRDYGFKKIFEKYTKQDVDKLLEFHTENGGLSRFVKIRHFYENILQKPITDLMVEDYAGKFSEIMKQKLTNPENLINDSVSFIKDNHIKYNFHIVSGSEQTELRYLCKELGIAYYFKSIHGSPTPKVQLVLNILRENHYKTENCCLIGDSINDYDAAKENNIKFYAYNNIALKEFNIDRYIYSFKAERHL